MKIFCVIGSKNTGKTTLIENMIPYFKEKGKKVATLKHHYGDFKIDHERKDSSRFYKAGADIVIISSPYKIALIQKLEKEKSISELIKEFLKNIDILIIEGYKKSEFPKVAIVKNEENLKNLISESNNIIAVVSKEEIETNLPFFYFNQFQKLMSFLENTLNI